MASRAPSRAWRAAHVATLPAKAEKPAAAHPDCQEGEDKEDSHNRPGELLFLLLVCSNIDGGPGRPPKAPEAHAQEAPRRDGAAAAARAREAAALLAGASAGHRPLPEKEERCHKGAEKARDGGQPDQPVDTQHGALDHHEFHQHVGRGRNNGDGPDGQGCGAPTAEGRARLLRTGLHVCRSARGPALQDGQLIVNDNSHRLADDGAVGRLAGHLAGLGLLRNRARLPLGPSLAGGQA
mmetsp:Transcript_18975/g.55047  ORF Transcript_18975/g.55047 Transcript_18975/m.55047 type:complete len:238 (-) Transcript_18975:37-750(-)